MRSRPEMTAAWAASAIESAVGGDELLDVVITGMKIGEPKFQVGFGRGRETHTFEVSVRKVSITRPDPERGSVTEEVDG